MAEMDFDELVMRIIKASGLDREAVLARINSKVVELSGLVSKRGAAHIIANSFGIQLHESKKGQVLSLKDVVSGLNNVSVKGVVTKVFPVNEFDKNGRKGRVGSVIINDGTSEARLVFWNDTAEALTSGKINVGDFLKAHHLRSKKGNFGMELHLSARSRIELNPDEKPPEIKVYSNPGPQSSRYFICDLQEGVNAEIKACLVQLYDRKPFYDVCPECGKSVKEGKCSEHGEVKPVKALILNGIFDDGTGTIRCVFFKQQAEALLGCSTEHAVQLMNETNDPSAIIKKKNNIIGDVFVLSGRVVHNNFTDNSELMVNSIVRANPVAEVKKLVK